MKCELFEVLKCGGVEVCRRQLKKLTSLFFTRLGIKVSLVRPHAWDEHIWITLFCWLGSVVWPRMKVSVVRPMHGPDMLVG